MNGHKRDTSVTDECVGGGPVSASKPLFEMSMQKFGLLTVSLPFVSLIVCFVSAVLFQYDVVSKTETCSTVPNMVPSISAVTGVSPQRYIWRVCIALHCAPRFIIGYMYWSYYIERIQYVKFSAPRQGEGGLFSAERVYRALASFIFYTYTVEISCLVGITYISNVENYPIHEKLFIVFMVTSLLHELLTLVIIRWSHPQMHRNPVVAGSFRLKLICFALIMTCTAGLIYFYFQHRWYCKPGSFTMFSTFEYVIGFTNMFFHYTAVREFAHLRCTFGPTIQPSLAAPLSGTPLPKDSVGSGSSMSSTARVNDKPSSKMH